MELYESIRSSGTGVHPVVLETNGSNIISSDITIFSDAGRSTETHFSAVIPFCKILFFSEVWNILPSLTKSPLGVNRPRSPSRMDGSCFGGRSPYHSL